MKKWDLLQNLQMALGIYDSILFMPHTLQENVMVSYLRYRKHFKKKILFLGGTIMGLLSNIDCVNLDEEKASDLKHLYYTCFIRVIIEGNCLWTKFTMKKCAKISKISFKQAHLRIKNYTCSDIVMRQRH